MVTSLRTGQTILHFRVIGPIGKGGMGAVYKAEDLKLGRTVAIKALLANELKDENSRKRFLKEARAASSLNHPNIVTIHSVEESDGVDFIVMEYLEGRTLSEVIESGPLDIARVADLGSQVADALSAAHAAGIVHRDIKSANIVVTARNQVKLLDFGLAKTFVPDQDFDRNTLTQLTQAGMVVGTVSYMSPEQTRGEMLDGRSDIFSLGCVLYEALTGKLPFTGPSVLSVMHQIAAVDPPPPSLLRPGLPAALDNIFSRALAKNKEDRYQNAIDLAKDLQSLLELPTKEVPLYSPITAVDPAEAPLIVGRRAQLNIIQENLRRSFQREGKIIFITGEPGIGKSALTDQFVLESRKNHPELLISRGRCVEHFGTAEAYLPFLDAIGTLLTTPLRERIVQILRTFAPTWFMQFPAAFSSSGAIEKSKQESIGATKERMLREMGDALRELSSIFPVAFVLEDLHWADPSSIDLLRFIAQKISGMRLLLLGTFRDEEIENTPLKALRIELRAHSQSEEIPLGLLDLASVREYFQLRFSPNSFPKELIETVYKKTEGHALFISGVAQQLVENQSIVFDEGEWKLTQPFSQMQLDVPESLRSMVGKRVDALPDEAKKIFQYASVSGEEFLSTILAEILEADEMELEEELARLCKVTRLVQTAGEEDLPDGSLAIRYRFIHALYQNFLYENLLPKRRILLHRKTAEQLLKHYGNKSERVANQLATHFEKGRDFEKAVEYFLIAGENAAKIYANEEATTLFTKALDSLSQISDRAEEKQWQDKEKRLRECLGDVLSLRGLQSEARVEFEKALLLFPVTSDSLKVAELHRKNAKTYELQRRYPEAMEEYNLAVSVLSTPPESDDDAPSWWIQLLQIELDRHWLLYVQNQIPAMEELSEKIRPQIQQYGTAEQQAHFYQNLSLLGYRKDRFKISEQSLSYVLQALSASRKTANKRLTAFAEFGTAFARLWRKEFDEAEPLLLQSLNTAERLGDIVLISRCLTYLTLLYRQTKDLQKTKEYGKRSLEIAQASGMDEYTAAAIANLAWLEWQETGKLEECITQFETAIQTWNRTPNVFPFRGFAYWPLFANAVKVDDLQKAGEYANAILHPSQQRLEDPLTEQLQHGIDLLADSNSKAAKEAFLKALALAEQSRLI